MSEITYEEFLKVDMRVGTIVSAERVAKNGMILAAHGAEKLHLVVCGAPPGSQLV